MKAATTMARPQTITVRPCTDADGEAIQWMTYQNGVTLGLDWTHVAPYWLIAERDKTLMGCIQLCPSLPIAALEMLSVLPTLPPREKARTVRHLLLAGCLTLKRMGAQYVRGMIEPRRQDYIDILTRRGAIHLTDGGVYCMRVA